MNQQRPSALRRLRAYTNYLTPQTGPLSTDTWAGIVIYLRNLLINWAVFVPLFLLLVLIPIVYKTTIWACSGSDRINLALLVSAGGALLYGIVSVCSLIPSHRPPQPLTDSQPRYASTSSIRWRIVYPALGWTLLIPWLLDFADGPLIRDKHLNSWLAHGACWIVPAIYVALMTVGYGLAWCWQLGRADPGIQLFRANFWRWVAASTGAALLTWVMLSIVATVLPLEPVPPTEKSPTSIDTATVLAVFAPLGLAVVHVLQTSLYIGLRRETELADLDREWLARVNAMILRLAAGWCVLSLGCLILPQLIYLNGPNSKSSDLSTWSAGVISSVGGITVLIGAAGAWLGKIWPSIEKFVDRPGAWDFMRTYLPTALGVVFGFGLLVAFGGVANFVLAWLQADWGDFVLVHIFDQASTSGKVADQPSWLPLFMQVLFAVPVIIGVLTFRHVNVNRFSMHAVYRNRLMRAFLGSARNWREHDPFTGFDPKDNVPLSLLRQVANSLFPVVNTTLNIATGNNAEWAERKAASFIFTPLACGSEALRHPGQDASEIDPCGAFVPTDRFAGLETLKAHPTKPTETGPGLGSVLTVSGAAVSPSWGYHSSRITAFLMTLFNVRLGVWLPNPSKATADELRLARPSNSLMALIDEMLGETTDESQAIYLSDGGHFENLGLYEMFRRRCSWIVVVDAGADDKCTLVDLGNAIRKVGIDLGVGVKMRDIRIYPRDKLEFKKHLKSKKNQIPEALGFAYGDIVYSKWHTGHLLYIKPSFLPSVPTDVRSYGAEHELFPHELTLDQWFSESQFESYRELGQYQMNELVNRAEARDLAGIFAAARGTLQPQTPANDDGQVAVVAAIRS